MSFCEYFRPPSAQLENWKFSKNVISSEKQHPSPTERNPPKESLVPLRWWKNEKAHFWEWARAVDSPYDAWGTLTIINPWSTVEDVKGLPKFHTEATPKSLTHTHTHTEPGYSQPIYPFCPFHFPLLYCPGMFGAAGKSSLPATLREGSSSSSYPFVRVAIENYFPTPPRPLLHQKFLSHGVMFGPVFGRRQKDERGKGVKFEHKYF